MLAITAAAAEGVESFAVVHDSYGTLAADCAVLVRNAKQSFARLYTTNDMLGSFYTQFRAQGGDAIPDPPTKGTLDVNGVLHVVYHVGHVDMFSSSDQAAIIGSLVLAPLVALVLLAVVRAPASARAPVVEQPV